MFASQQPCDCTFLSSIIIEKWVWFIAVTDSRRLEHQSKWLQVVMSVPRLCLSTICDVWWFDSSIGCLEYRMANKIKEYIINSDKEGTVCISAPFLICWTYILDKEFESNDPIFFIGEPRWLDIRLFTPLTRKTCTFCIISEKLEVLSELVNPINVTNQTFIMKHRPVAPRWRVSRSSVVMCTWPE